MKKLRYALITAGVVIIIAAFLCIAPWQRHIVLSLEGIQFRIGEPEYSEKVTINIDGTRTFNIIGTTDNFNGKFEISTLPETIGAKASFYGVSKSSANLLFEKISQGAFAYYDQVNIGGQIIYNFDLQKLVIAVQEPYDVNRRGWNGEDGLMIAVPAQTREDGVALCEKFAEKHSWLSTVK